MRGKRKRPAAPGIIAGTDEGGLASSPSASAIARTDLAGPAEAAAGGSSAGSGPAGDRAVPPAPAAPAVVPVPAAPASASPASPGPASREILEVLRGRLAELLPGWAARPEDPVQVLLEVVAGCAGDLREELGRIEDRDLPRILARLGAEPRPPRAARAVVAFERAGSVPGETTIPGGSRLVAPRSRSAVPPPPRADFELAGPVRVGSARLTRVLGTDGHEVREVPVHRNRGAAPAGAEVALFGSRTRAGRELYLGDAGLGALREGGGLRIDWPGYPREIARSRWEYRASGGWRTLPVRFERGPGADPVLRMRIAAPIPDLSTEVRERADLPWLRCSLPGGAVDLAAPRLAPDHGPEAAGEGKPFARIFLEGALESIDLSFEDRLTAPAPDGDLDPALYLGWDGPSASTVHAILAGEILLAGATRSRFTWEYSSGGAWTALAEGDLLDGTGGFARTGSFTAAPGSGWEALRLFGEELWWIRARWTEGDRAAPAAIALLVPAAGEAFQGRRVDSLPLGRAAGEGDRIDLARPAEGEIEGLEALELRAPDGVALSWRRLPEGGVRGAGERCFTLSRHPDGRTTARLLTDGPPIPPREGGWEILGHQVRLGIGAHGNLPAGTALVLEESLPGISGAWLPLPASGGRDRETLEALAARTSAEWRTGGRAVTAGDYDRLVRGLLPGSEGAVAVPDPARPGGVLVIPVPRSLPGGAGRFPPALLEALAGELRSRAPLGTPVRAVEGLFTEVVAVVAARPEGDREALRGRLAADIAGLLDPLRSRSRDPSSGNRLIREPRGTIMVEVLGRPAEARLRRPDGSPPAPPGPEELLVLAGVRFDDEGGREEGNREG